MTIWIGAELSSFSATSFATLGFRRQLKTFLFQQEDRLLF